MSEPVRTKLTDVVCLSGDALRIDAPDLKMYAKLDGEQLYMYGYCLNPQTGNKTAYTIVLLAEELGFFKQYLNGELTHAKVAGNADTELEQSGAVKLAS